MRNALLYRPLVDLATLEEQHIFQTYHLNCVTIMELVAQLEPDLLPAINLPNAIPPTVQVLSVLYYLASGPYQVTVDLAAGMLQPMFSNVLRDVQCALIKYMCSYILFPRHAELPTVKAAFYHVAHVPHVIAAVDGTHIALVPPRRNEQLHRNRKNFNSVKVHTVCLADQYISHVTARYPGSVHDSYILRNSSIPYMMAPLQRDRSGLSVCTPAYVCPSALCTLVSLPYCLPALDMPLPSMHTGDSGYPNLSWLMTPVRHPTSAAEDCYNEAHGHTRRATEIIVACCMLHNLALRHHFPLLDAEDGEALPVPPLTHSLQPLPAT
ncbi:putative nuclease HARBI1 [Pleurodeles waltl]|uniref:putative nuclease HARBI1 n=1 Tax=Pleurodeles waltl TaxID=8319 RepID=UPI003709A3C9